MKPRILFVDDEAPMREMLSLYFRKKGCEVATATTSAEAIRLVGINSFDVAVLDVDLAGENGLELLSFLKNGHPELPIVMFTGLNSDADLLEKAMARGADGFMRKTEPLHELFDVVQAFLPKAA